MGLYIENRIKRVKKYQKNRKRAADREDLVCLVYCLICVVAGLMASKGGGFLIGFGVFGLYATYKTWGKDPAQVNYKRKLAKEPSND